MLGSNSDQKLISKAQNGSQRSWVKLVKRYEQRIYNYCLRMTFNDADAKELMQEIFLAIYRNSPSYKGQGAFVNWMMRIAANKTTDFLRSRQRNPLFNAFAVHEDDMSTQIEPQIEVEKNRDNQRVLNIMSMLPDNQRLVVELKFFQHMTFDEIAEQTDIPVNTIKTRFYTALRKLKNNLEIQHAV